MLPMLAMAVAGYMAKQGSAGVQSPSPAGGGLGAMLGGLLGGKSATGGASPGLPRCST